MEQTVNLKRKSIIYLIISIIFLLLASFVHYQNQLSVSGKEKYKKLQSDFLKQEQVFNELFEKLTQTSINDIIDLVNFCEKNGVDKNTFAFFVYQDSLLSAWSSNEITPSKCWQDSLPQISQINNRWVYVKQKATPLRQYTGYLIIHDIDTQNEDNNMINNPFEHHIAIDAPQEGYIKECYTIYNSEGNPVFALTLSNTLKKNNKASLLEMILWMIVITAFFFTLISFLRQTNVFSKNQNLLWFFLVALLFIFSFIVSNCFHFSSDLFSPIYYSSHYDSLGTLFFNSYLILLGSIFFMQFANLDDFEKHSNKIKITVSSIAISFVLGTYIIVYLIITGITNDSVVVLKPEIIYRYDLLSIIAISSIVFVLWSAFIVTYKSLNQIFLLLQERKIFIRIIELELIVSSLLFVVFYFCFSNRTMSLYIPYLLFLLLVIVTTVFVLRKRKWHNLLFYCIVYLILSCIVLFTANQTVDEREKKYKESMAEMILSIENPFALYSFRDLVDEIEKDMVLADMFNTDASTKDIQQYIILKYAKRYAEDYQVSIDIGLESSLEEKMKMNQSIHSYPRTARITGDNKVLFRRIGFGRSEYILNASIPVNKEVDAGNIVMIFRMSISSSQQSELEKTLQKEMSNYCYAGYENNILTMSIGNRNISYLFNLSDYNLDTLYSGMEFVANNVTHTIFTHDKMVILVSSEKKIIWDKISFLVILFLTQFIFSLVPAFLSNSYHNPQKLWKSGFQESIQLFVSMLITITVIITAFSFFRFFQIQRNNNLEDTQRYISQRINKIITSSISEIDTLTDLSNEALQLIDAELRRFYEPDFPDVNLYNKKGENVKGYGKGIYINTYISPFAFKSFALNRTNMYIVNEIYDREEYKSFYEAILNKKDEIIGYANLFSYSNKQRDMLDYRQTLFLTKFMSSCIIIVILIVILSIIFIRYITRPLVKVTERLSTIGLGKELKKIKWNKDDELGQLVNTYNILIDRLRTSAELLEKSSQEIAWKNMARQIAHEIKNPLTPMRLKTQQMLRTLNASNEMDREKLKRYFAMIIQQTDTLTEVAVSFSNFAKINQRNGSPENLIPIIQNTLSSFNESSSIRFQLINKANQDEVISFVNKSQMSQVFNNLIKNAIQAKKTRVTQFITIEIENYGDKMWQIKITDTGIGMTDEVKKKIFSPNFTTKTSGTGLGLAMVQRIIITWGGDITFESTYNVGTSFFITLPKYILPQN
ncbi:MAG: GHKL domain-containing protein [Bacteroidales bacterium]|jgi:signal transduction histidine kinase|nr:GHKL domain-containing protein [Bacteroidales bacterium]